MKKRKKRQIFEIGFLLGLQQNDVCNIIEKKNKIYYGETTNISTNPFDTYKIEGGHYGTISIKDFSKNN